MSHPVSPNHRSIDELLALEGPKFIGQAYLTLMGRAVDPEGFRHYDSQVRAGMSKLQVLSELRASSEGQAFGADVAGLGAKLVAPRPMAVPADWSVDNVLRLHGVTFIELAHVAIVGRSPDEATTGRYLAKLRAGHHKIQLLEEMRQCGIGESHRPTLRGLDAALKRLDGGLFPVALNAEELLELEDGSFIDCAYKTLLRRSPDPGGFDAYLQRLRAGRSKLGIVHDLSMSSEGRTQKVVLPGLALKLGRYARATNPGYGWAYRAVTGVEAETAVERRLRSIESHLLRSVASPATTAADLLVSVEEVEALLSGVSTAGNK
jgi:Domain of unknown function (DUF4214)